MSIISFREITKNAEILMDNFKDFKKIDCPYIYKNKVKILNNIYLTKKISNNDNEEIYEAVVKINNNKYKVACSLGPSSKPLYFNFPNMNKCVHFPICYGELYCSFYFIVKNEKETNIKYYPEIIQKMYYKEKKRIPKIHQDDLFNYILHNPLIFSFINSNTKGNLNDFLAKSNITKKAVFNCLAQIYLSLFFTFNIKDNDGLKICNPSIFLYEKIKKEGYYHYIINNKDYYLPNLGFLFTINKFNRFPSKNTRNDNLISISKSFNIPFKNDLIECFKIENKNEMIKCVLLILEKNKIILNEIPKKSKILHTCIL